ncbi:Hypothetical protein NGAL_HAMBI2605_14640 [Neorhizobium galegae bv. orientalis]|nr:Hypothetical protein NGAL_HAMBI2605_14640 [Neorhizobium galegae bv. orientalis]
MIGTRGWYIIFSLAAASAITYAFPNALEKSTTALEGIISVFSILAGVLVAVMSIIGDPSMLLSGNWRLGYEHAKDIQAKIGNYANLIAVYVVTLLLVLIAIVLKEALVLGYDWFFGVVLWFTSFGFLLSIPLPYSLMAIQKERMNEEIKRRRHGA